MIESVDQFLNVVKIAQWNLEGRAQFDMLEQACKDYLIFAKKLRKEAKK